MNNLTDCPVCEHQVSPEAQSCPNCGHKLQDSFFEKLFKKGMILVYIFIFILLVLGALQGNGMATTILFIWAVGMVILGLWGFFSGGFKEG